MEFNSSFKRTNINIMKTKATFDELQYHINQLSDEVRNSTFDYFSVSPTDKEQEVLSFEKNDKAVPNYVTDWEIG